MTPPRLVREHEVLVTLLEELPEAFLQCRGLRHAWRVDQDFYVHQDHKATKLLTIARDLTCMRCEAVQRREIFIQRKWGLEKVANRYTYAPEYALHGAPRGVKPSLLVYEVQYHRQMQRIAAQQRSSRSA